MKKWAVSLIGTGLLLIAAALIIGTFQQHHQSVPSRGRSLAAVSPATSKQNQVLVVYLSRTGHTRRVATDLHQQVGGDLYQLKTRKSYPKSYQKMLTVAKAEQEHAARPKLKGKLPDLSRYQTIYLGYPIWWDKNPMAINSFLDHYSDLKGKTIYPFTTSGSSGLGSSVAELRQHAHGAKIGSGLPITDSQMNQRSSLIKAWLQKIHD